MLGSERVEVNGRKWGYSLYEIRVYPPKPQPTIWQELGDVDANSTVSVQDALLTLQAAADKLTLNVVEADAADIDGNGRVTAQDALSILQFVTQKIAGFY